MMAQHLELLVEEPSMEVFLRNLLPRMLPAECTFNIRPFQGKPDLLDKLQNRLRAYAKWLPSNYRIFVVVDRDNDNCKELKQKLETIASSTQLLTRSQALGRPWQIVNRIAIEELEAWYFGDWQAVCNAYPRVTKKIPNQARYRQPDAIRGGTSEAFERILKRYGYFKTGLRKTEAARDVGIHIDSNRSRSHSFVKFREAIIEATA